MAATSYTPISNRMEDAGRIEAILEGFQQTRFRRFNFEGQWQETSLVFLPEWANTFFFGYKQWPGAKKSQYQIEAYPSIAAHRFMAIANSFMTPWTYMWSKLVPTDDYLLKQRGVSEYYEAVSKIVWRERYKRTSGFIGQQLINWLSLGVFGNQNMFVEELYSHTGERGLSYSAVPIGQVYYVTNHQGNVDAFYRAFQWTARQIYQKWPDTFPEALRPALEQKSQNQYWIVMAMYPNDEYDAEAVFHPKKGKPYSGVYVSVDGRCILEEGGYSSYPMPCGRYIVFPDEDYGRGPGQIVLGGAKSMQAMKGTYLKQTHRKGDPVILTPEAGILDASLFRPGDVVPGGMQGGKLNIGVLPTGDIDDIEKAMAREQSMIDDGFLTSLFQLALKTEDQPQLSVRQMMEFLEQRAMLIGPTLGRQITEYMGGLVEREVDLCSRMGLFPKQPQVIREAGGDYTEEWDNPLMRAIAASDAATAMQAVEMAAQVAQSTQDTTVWDAFAFQRMIPDLSRKRGMPVSWMSTDKEVKQKQQSRAQQAEREARAQEMPAQAAIMKAQAITAKAQTGGNTGGTLSGTAPGGMPVVPGNAPGIQGQPGIGGRPGLPGRPGP